MLNNASKFALGVTGVAILAAIFADDRAASLVLVGVVIAAAVIAYGIARTVGPDLPPLGATDAASASTAVEPTDIGRPSFGPLVLAIGATVAVAGGALGSSWVLVGALVAIVGAGVWLFDAFRTPGLLSARDAANVDYRFLSPLALPVASFALAITIAYSFSRVLLAVNETASWVVAFVVAAVVLAVLWVIAEKRPNTKLVSGLAGVGMLATLAVGGTFASVGEREFHHAGHELPTAQITAREIAWDRNVMALPANTEAQIVFTNLDIGVFHNVAIYTTDEPGTPIYNGRPSTRGALTYALRTPAAGTYRYICDFHPNMVGELRVTEGGAGGEGEHHDEGESPEAKGDESNTPVTSSSEPNTQQEEEH